MAAKTRELAVFAWLPEKPVGRFVPAGLLQLTELVGANPNNRELTSRFAYGLGYLKRPEAVEVDPVSLSLADREAVRGQQLFPVNGLGEFGGIRDAAPDAWGRRVIEARRKVPANSLSEPNTCYKLVEPAGSLRTSAPVCTVKRHPRPATCIRSAT